MGCFAALVFGGGVSLDGVLVEVVGIQEEGVKRGKQKGGWKEACREWKGKGMFVALLPCWQSP